MPVFGADPDKPTEYWSDMPTTTTRYVSKPVRELTNYFAYHRHARMSQRCNEEDKARRNMFFSRKLKQGFDAASIKAIIDRFYQSPAGQYEHASALFCKDSVQKELAEDIDIHNNDVILQWLLDGMPSDCTDLTDAREVRKAILLNCDESLLRYPEIVAEIVRVDDPEPYLSQRLSALEDLIFWNLGNSDEGAGHLHDALASIDLPKELASKGRSPKSIRMKHATVQDAIVKIPVRRTKENR